MAPTALVGAVDIPLLSERTLIACPQAGYSGPGGQIGRHGPGGGENRHFPAVCACKVATKLLWVTLMPLTVQ